MVSFCCISFLAGIKQINSCCDVAICLTQFFAYSLIFIKIQFFQHSEHIFNILANTLSNRQCDFFNVKQGFNDWLNRFFTNFLFVFFCFYFSKIRFTDLFESSVQIMVIEPPSGLFTWRVIVSLSSKPPAEKRKKFPGYASWELKFGFVQVFVELVGVGIWDAISAGDAVVSVISVGSVVPVGVGVGVAIVGVGVDVGFGVFAWNTTNFIMGIGGGIINDERGSGLEVLAIASMRSFAISS